MLVKTRKSRDILTNQDLAEVQQPLARDGYSNDTFDQLYPDTPNPWRGTERDRKTRVVKSVFTPSEEYSRNFEKIFKKQ